MALFMDLECLVTLVDLHSFPDLVSIQKLLVGIGHVDYHKNPCQALEVHQRRNQLSQEDQAACHVKVPKSNLMGLVLTGLDPSPRMM